MSGAARWNVSPAIGRRPTGGFPARGCVQVPQLPSGRGRGPDAGEIGHGGRQQKLGFGLEMPLIARLTQAQLHQTRQAVFARLAPDPIGCKGRAGLQGPGLLQQLFLGMQADAAPAPGGGLHTLRLQGTDVTDRPLEDEGPARNPLPVSVAVAPLTVEAGRDLSGRTGAISGLQVNGEILLGEIRAAGRVWAPWRLEVQSKTPGCHRRSGNLNLP